MEATKGAESVAAREREVQKLVVKEIKYKCVYQCVEGRLRSRKNRAERLSLPWHVDTKRVHQREVEESGMFGDTPPGPHRPEGGTAPP